MPRPAGRPQPRYLTAVLVVQQHVLTLLMNPRFAGLAANTDGTAKHGAGRVFCRPHCFPFQTSPQGQAWRRGHRRRRTADETLWTELWINGVRPPGVRANHEVTVCRRPIRALSAADQSARRRWHTVKPRVTGGRRPAPSPSGPATRRRSSPADVGVLQVGLDVADHEGDVAGRRRPALAAARRGRRAGR